MNAREIRQKYLEFFKSKGHAIIPSASVVPENDPTVLFTTAGMHPLVPYLMGEVHPQGKRLVDSQKCIRTGDIDDVGDNRHLTFFEMLGNWSLGDYFKKEAISWSWEFLTDEKWLGLDPKRIYVTVFAGDENSPVDNESIETWKEQYRKMGIEAGVCGENEKAQIDSRIFLLGAKDNWWGPAGETGPCGPCSEMFYDVRPEEGSLEGKTHEEWVDEFRIMEIWNDVFMEFNKKKGDNRVLLIDGMHCLYDENFNLNEKLLELINSYVNDKILVVNGFGDKAKEVLKGYDIDVFTFEQEIKKDNKEFFIKLLEKYNLSSEDVIYLDHDENNLNGAKQTGIKKVKLFALGDDVSEAKSFINSSIYFFEKMEQQNVDTGMGLERTITVLTGKENVFDTDLFLPIIAKIEELSNKKYADPSEEIKKSMRIISDHIKASVFIIADGIEPSNTERGYVLRRLIRRAIRQGHLLGINNHFAVEVAKVVQEMYGDVYPEILQEKVLVELQKEEEKFRGTLEKGLIKFDEYVNKHLDKKLTGVAIFALFTTFGFPMELSLEVAKDKKVELAPDAVDLFYKLMNEHQELSRTASAGMFKGGLADNKEETTQLHTAAHLMLAGLRKVLGEHVHQKGSNINGERLRFDFSHPEKMTDEQKKQVEEFVNSAITAKVPVEMNEMSLDEAKASGAEGAFENKYGDVVKVYKIEGFSNEICGGPHVANTADIKGTFKIKKEESSSAGVRRIKAVIENN